jgi:hypothetical protein
MPLGEAGDFSGTAESPALPQELWLQAAYAWGTVACGCDRLYTSIMRRPVELACTSERLKAERGRADWRRPGSARKDNIPRNRDSLTGLPHQPA